MASADYRTPASHAEGDTHQIGMRPVPDPSVSLAVTTGAMSRDPTAFHAGVTASLFG